MSKWPEENPPWVEPNIHRKLSPKETPNLTHKAAAVAATLLFRGVWGPNPGPDAC